MDTIALWEQEIQENTQELYKQAIQESSIYNFYGESVESIQEGLLTKLKEKFKKKYKEKSSDKPKKKKIDIEKFKKDYPEIMKIAKKAFDEMDNNKGFSLNTSKEDTNYNSVIDGESTYLILIDRDIFDFIDKGENARDYDVNERFWKVEAELFKLLKDNGITDYGTLDDSGDWDDGSIDLNLK